MEVKVSGCTQFGNWNETVLLNKYLHMESIQIEQEEFGDNLRTKS